MNLNNQIYDFNLAFTNTVSDVYEICRAINNGRTKEIDLNDSVSLYDIVKKFYDERKAFNIEKDTLLELFNRLGDKVSYIHHSISDDFESLSLEVLKTFTSIFDSSYSIATLVRYHDEYHVMLDNGFNMHDKRYKRKDVEFDAEMLKKYFDFLERHDLFLESFRELQNKFIFGNGTTVLFSKIDGDLFDDDNIFTISFGNNYFNTYDFIEIKFRLGESLEILYDQSKVVIREEEVNSVEECRRIIDELLNSVYLNREYLMGLYRSNDKGKILEKRNKDEK